VTSAYGQHLVRVTERTEARLPTLDEVRDRVEGEWRASRATALRDLFTKEMMSRYTVVLPAPHEVLGK
jgi:parvulin-like peptidyl-prolyl isomerase